MKIEIVAATRNINGEPPRSTAYYYADIERLKNKNAAQNVVHNDAQNGDKNGEQIPAQVDEIRQNPDELSEYVESNEVFNDGAVREVPPLRDRRQWSPPEYSTPEHPRKVPEETYSTAGTFPMPEPKEKEPLLAELEIVGRVPLTQLDNASGIRRSRSWYLCCPNVGDEEVSRESSWRYSSLRPVTAPPIPGQNGITLPRFSESGGEERASLLAERDALARALASERARGAAAARAHDARLAELHGVIAELVRRRRDDARASRIPEEDLSEECESTTQPAGDLDDDADPSPTEQNESSLRGSRSEGSVRSLPDDGGAARSPQQSAEQPCMHVRVTSPVGGELACDTSLDLSERDSELCLTTTSVEKPCVHLRVTSPVDGEPVCDTSLDLSERDSKLCLTTARWCRESRSRSAGSCERERGSPEEGRARTASGGGTCYVRRAKVAARVRLARAADQHEPEEPQAAERLALDVCAQAGLREALVAADATESGAVWAARCARLAADCRVLECALQSAKDTAHRLWCACAVQESCCVSMCCALRAADRALEVYDVLLALAETHHRDRDEPERSAAELVARQLLSRLDAEQATVSIGGPLLSAGPWLEARGEGPARGGVGTPWCEGSEARLRAHAARLKAETVALRATQPEPGLFSYHEIDENEIPKSMGGIGMAEMEAAVMMQEVLSAREAQLCAAERARTKTHTHDNHKSRQRWTDARAAETDL